MRFGNAQRWLNLLGQKIRLLINSRQPAGSYEIEWDGVDGWGNEAASGVYIYRLKTQDRILSKKMFPEEREWFIGQNLIDE